jgi:PAS domain S-box-containing protein
MASDPEKVKILLVDDRPGNLIALEGVLERPDYELLMAGSGEDALKLCLNHEVAVILLDVAMPGLDGFQVASILKSRRRTRVTPIIFVTASVLHIEWIYEAYSVGGVDFLLKPFDPHAVKAKVAVFVEMFRQRKEIERQAAQIESGERARRALELRQMQLENERRYRNLAESIPELVWTAERVGELGYVNRRWHETTGLDGEQTLGRGWRAAVHPEDLARLDEAWERAAREEAGFVVELRLRGGDGTDRWHLCRGVPERDQAGVIAHWLGTFSDVDDQKRAQERARVAVRLRDEFLSVASHELRTPLTVLRIQLQAIEQICARPEVASAEPRLPRKTMIALRQCDRLGSLVERLLDVSRITTGRLRLQELETFDLVELAREMIEQLRDAAERAGCELRLHGDRAVIGTWDRPRLEQVIVNLLANALKYAPKSQIDLTVAEGGLGAVLTVEDRGIGIDSEQVGRIFERFARAVSERNYGGLGLGLYLVREIVEAHGGRVSAQSEAGAGSAFRVELPLVVPAELAPGPATGETPEPFQH